MVAGASAAGLPALLRDLLDAFQQASGATILSLVLYDADADSYYAPFAVGIEDEALGASLADMNGQLARYREDERQGKAPAELAV